MAERQPIVRDDNPQADRIREGLGKSRTVHRRQARWAARVLNVAAMFASMGLFALGVIRFRLDAMQIETGTTLPLTVPFVLFCAVWFLICLVVWASLAIVAVAVNLLCDLHEVHAR